MDDVKYRKWYEKFVGARLKFLTPIYVMGISLSNILYEE